jgi:hypothetical protein
MDLNSLDAAAVNPSPEACPLAGPQVLKKQSAKTSFQFEFELFKNQ